MNSPTPIAKPWGLVATFSLGVIALLAGQMAALAALSWWFGASLDGMPNFSGDGVAVTLVIAVSTPVQIALLVLFAQRAGGVATDYLGWTWPRRDEVVFGVIAVIAAIVVTNAVSWLLGRGLVTQFQSDIYRSAAAAGWLRTPRDVWPVIVISALLWALIHVQYDWYVTGQVFAFGVLLGWMRWATGSTLLTILLHALINLEGMIETVVQGWLS